MTPTAWIIIALVIVATTAAPFVLIQVARRAGSRPAAGHGGLPGRDQSRRDGGDGNGA